RAAQPVWESRPFSSPYTLHRYPSQSKVPHSKPGVRYLYYKVCNAARPSEELAERSQRPPAAALVKVHTSPYCGVHGSAPATRSNGMHKDVSFAFKTEPRLILSMPIALG